MIIEYILLAITVISIIFAGGIGVGFKIAARPVMTAPASMPVINVLTPNAQVTAALKMVAVRDEHIRILETIRFDTPSPYTVLPWQAPITSPELHLLQDLADDVQELEAEVTRLIEQLELRDEVIRQKEHTRKRHWESLKRLRAQLTLMVPLAEFEQQLELRTRSLTVAKSAFTRAATVTDEFTTLSDEFVTTLTELEIACAEAQSLDELQSEFDLILKQHQPMGVV